MKFGSDKGELRVRRSSYGPLQWRLATPAPGTVARCRRWNIVLIAVLAFLVLGVFVVAEAPRRAPNSADASWKESAKSVKGTPPEIHGRHGPGYLSGDLNSAHHRS